MHKQDLVSRPLENIRVSKLEATGFDIEIIHSVLLDENLELYMCACKLKLPTHSLNC